MKLMDPRFPWRMLETLCSSKNLLKNSMSCLGCNTAMSPISCSSSKSPDGLIWRCSHCNKYKNIRTDSALSCSSIKGLYGIAISQMTGPSEKTVSDSKQGSTGIPAPVTAGIRLFSRPGSIESPLRGC